MSVGYYSFIYCVMLMNQSNDLFKLAPEQKRMQV